MHYVRVNPPDCYKCYTCGLLGDFQNYDMATCDGGTVPYGGDLNAWDVNGWTWEKEYANEHCEVGATTTTSAPGEPTTTKKPYVPPPDPTFPYDPCEDHDSDLYKESLRLCHVGVAQSNVAECCRHIGGQYCDDLMQNCPFDACFNSQQNADMIAGEVEEVLVNTILTECDDLVVDEENYNSFATAHPTKEPTDGLTRRTTRSPTTSNPTTASPTTARPTTSRPTTSLPTTASPTTSRPTTSRPTTSRPTTSRPTTGRPTP